MTTEPRYDLKERTFQFGVRVLRFASVLPRTVIAVELTRQLIRAATSVGANVEEAEGAESRRDTAHKMAIARKEARESRYWLRMILAAGASKGWGSRAVGNRSNRKRSRRTTCSASPSKRRERLRQLREADLRRLSLACEGRLGVVVAATFSRPFPLPQLVNAPSGGRNCAFHAK
jgi:four helix bundle protein